MKTFMLVTGLLMLVPNAGSARCMSAALRISPKKRAKAAPTNAHVLVVVYGFKDRDKAGHLLDGAFFVGGGQKVALKVERLAQSDRAFRNTYLLLKPERALRPKTRYRLKLTAKRPPHRPLSLYYDKLRAYGFRTGAGADDKAPARVEVKSEGYSLRRLGCGPAESIGLKVEGLADDKTPKASLRLLLDVEEKKGDGSKRRFELLLPSSGGAGGVAFGHGMCSGNYKLVKGASYRIRVAAMDWAGNKGPFSSWVKAQAR